MKSKVIVILGPTSAGKSALAVKLAKKFKGEVVSADSRQVYRGLDIGTGKISKKEMRGIPHHLLDIASPKRKFTVWQYQQRAYKIIDQIFKKIRVPFLVGGSPFYIYAVTAGKIFPRVEPNLKLRTSLEKQKAKDLLLKLKKKDPERAKTIDPHNKVRLIRALEIIDALGKVPRIENKPRYLCLKIGLDLPKEVLSRKIRQRLKKRIREGLIKEFKKLKAKGLSLKRMQELGLEYFWGAKLLKGEIKKSEFVERLEKDIWRFARKQMSWFGKDKDIKWIKGYKEAEKLVGSFLHD